MARRFEAKRIEDDHENMSNASLDELIKTRAQYLKENPHLIPFQKEIDRLLDNAGNLENRMKVLGIIMEGKLTELKEQLLRLSNMLSSSDR
jgi:hypothetical protein